MIIEKFKEYVDSFKDKLYKMIYIDEEGNTISDNDFGDIEKQLIYEIMQYGIEKHKLKFSSVPEIKLDVKMLDEYFKVILNLYSVSYFTYALTEDHPEKIKEYGIAEDEVNEYLDIFENRLLQAYAMTLGSLNGISKRLEEYTRTRN